MKRYLKHSSALLLALLLLLSMSLNAFAADSIVTFYGEREGFGFEPGSEYTATDLFDNFKDVMPGDMLKEHVEIRNKARDCDYIRIFMRAVPHDELKNPLSEKVAEHETIASMKDFLSQLNMRVYNGSQLIYEASPDEAGALADNVFLGALYYGESLVLHVELDVPASLGNEYANRVGEVDWIFLVECIDYEPDYDDNEDSETEDLTVKKVWSDENDKDKIRPDSVKMTLYKGKKAVKTVTLSEKNNWSHTWHDLSADYDWAVRENEVPGGYGASYRVKGDIVTVTNTSKLIETGQLNWPIPVLGGLGMMLIFLGVFVMRRKKENNDA